MYILLFLIKEGALHLEAKFKEEKFGVTLLFLGAYGPVSCPYDHVCPHTAQISALSS